MQVELWGFSFKMTRSDPPVKDYHSLKLIKGLSVEVYSILLRGIDKKDASVFHAVVVIFQ